MRFFVNNDMLAVVIPEGIPGVVEHTNFCNCVQTAVGPNFTCPMQLLVLFQIQSGLTVLQYTLLRCRPALVSSRVVRLASQAHWSTLTLGHAMTQPAYLPCHILRSPRHPFHPVALCCCPAGCTFGILGVLEHANRDQ